MKSLAVIFLFLQACLSFPFSADKSLKYSCEKLHGSCVLHNVLFDNESDLEQVVFQDVSDPLTIASGKIPHFTRKLSEKLPGVVDLVINGLEVQTLYVKPEMIHLEAVKNQIKMLEVDDDPDKTYQMITLDLSSNKLRDVQVLSRFKKLRQLTLDGNQLEHLSMDLFQGMSELRKISLENNLMHTFDTSRKLQLIKLQSVSLAGNRLIELDVVLWDLPSLKQLDVSKNNLYTFSGSLNQFTALEDAKLSSNYWDCDFLETLNPTEKLKLDEDEPGRCREQNLTTIKNLCCTSDPSGFLTTDLKNDYGIYNDKWEELRALKKSLHDFKQGTEQKLQQIGTLPEDRSLIERIEDMESKQKQLLEKLNGRQESVAVKEVQELRSIITDHKNTIYSLESKLSNLESQLEEFGERLNRFDNEDKFEKFEGIPEKLRNLEKQQSDQAALLNATTVELQNNITDLGKQQFRYHLSTVDLKSKLGLAQGRFSEVNVRVDKLVSQNGKLRKDVDDTSMRVNAMWNMLNEIAEGKEY